MKNGKIAVMTIVVETEEVIGLVSANSIKDMMSHWYPDLISIDIQESQIDDTREKPDPPWFCQQCKWCHNKQCWFNDSFQSELDGDVDVCFEPKDKSIDKQAVIDKYWKEIYRLAEEDQKNKKID